MGMLPGVLVALSYAIGLHGCHVYPVLPHDEAGRVVHEPESRPR